MVCAKRVIAFIVAALLAWGVSYAAPKAEFRGVWIATVFGLDWPSQAGNTIAVADAQKKELRRIVDHIADLGFNAVMLQVRPMADAFYLSDLEPTSQYLTGARGAKPTYDPLEFAVRLCHERGIECHAWINPFRVGKTMPETPIDKRYAKLCMTNRVGKVTMTILNPGLVESREHICHVVTDIARRYDVDGIVFDDYFYNPEFLPEDETAADMDTYRKSGSELSFADWRRDNINQTISLTSRELRKIKDGKIRFGVSPQGIAGGNGAWAHKGIPSLADYGVTTGDSQYGKIYSDPVNWLINGDLDYISPQIYWQCDNPNHPYGGLVRWWCDVAEGLGTHCWPSITIARFAKDAGEESVAEAITQLEANRDASFNSAPGIIVYSLRHLIGDCGADFCGKLASMHFATPAIVPPIPREHSVNPLAVNNLRYKNGHLEWDAAGDSRYIVYLIPESVDLIDAMSENFDGLSAEYIEAVTYTNSLKLSEYKLKGKYVAVSAYDRYGNEWTPTIIHP